RGSVGVHEPNRFTTQLISTFSILLLFNKIIKNGIEKTEMKCVMKCSSFEEARVLYCEDSSSTNKFPLLSRGAQSLLLASSSVSFTSDLHRLRDNSVSHPLRSTTSFPPLRYRSYFDSCFDSQVLVSQRSNSTKLYTMAARTKNA
ncbi:hypothetical protein RYX36_027482, partial [Vicia faba]